MAPSVPFALLAGVQLLAVASWAALAAGAMFPGIRQRLSPVISLGALCLAAADVVTGSDLGTSLSRPADLLRAGGAVLMAAGLVAGAPGSRPRGGNGWPQESASTPTLALAPLLIGGVPGTITAVALAAGAAFALRRRSPLPIGALPLAAGLGLAAAAAALGALLSGPLAGSVATAEAQLLLRGLAALSVLVWAATLSAGSLLAQVVSSILGALTLASVVVAAVVGTVVADRLGNQQASQVSSVAAGEIANVSGLQTQTAPLAAALAATGDSATFVKGLQALSQGRMQLAVEITRARGATRDKTLLKPAQNLDQAAIDELVTAGAVTSSLASGVGSSPILALQGSHPSVLVATVAPGPPAAAGQLPTTTFIYGFLIDESLLRTSGSTAGFAVTLVDLASGRVAASTLPAADSAAIATDQRVRRAVLAPPDFNRRSTLAEISTGAEPTLGLATLSDGQNPTVLIVVSASAEQVIGTQRAVLQVLFFSLLGSAVLVAALGFAVGNRIAKPVRRLTEAAERVRKGDLRVTTGIRGRDEVARLSRTFDAMTSSLARADEDLRTSAEQETAVRIRLEAVLASIGDGLVVVDGRGHIESVNPAAEVLLGPAAEVVGHPVADIVQGVSLDAPVAEGLLLGADGRSRPVVLAQEELSDRSGRVLVLRDTTREREVERMKTEFLSNVSHELRTPLTPIRGYAKILAGRVLPEAKVAEYAAVVLTSSVRLGRVVDLLVEVASLDAGRVVPVPERLPIGAFIDQRLDAWRVRAPERAGDLRRRVAAGLPDALVDPAWLIKAVDELMDNAVKFCPTGAITLAALLADGRIRLEVRDVGPGIPEGSRDALFSDFEQVDGSATRARDGLGLGLPFVRRVADVVGLRLSVTSTVGHGSSFALEMPSAATAMSSAAAAAPTAPPRQRRQGRHRLSPTP